MLSGHRSAWRRRRNTRAARIAIPLAIPMALGLTLGIVLAVSGGPVKTINQAVLGSCASASANAVASGGVDPSGSASAAPCTTASDPADPTATASANAVVPAAPAFDSGPIAFSQLGDLATDPVDGTEEPAVNPAAGDGHLADQHAPQLFVVLIASARGTTARPWPAGGGRRLGRRRPAGTGVQYVRGLGLGGKRPVQSWPGIGCGAGGTR